MGQRSIYAIQAGIGLDSVAGGTFWPFRERADRSNSSVEIGDSVELSSCADASGFARIRLGRRSCRRDGVCLRHRRFAVLCRRGSAAARPIWLDLQRMLGRNHVRRVLGRRLSRRGIASGDVLATGLMLMTTGSVVLLALTMGGLRSPALFAGLLIVVALAFGLSFPNVMNATMQPLPEIARRRQRCRRKRTADGWRGLERPCFRFCLMDGQRSR